MTSSMSSPSLLLLMPLLVSLVSFVVPMLLSLVPLLPDGLSAGFVVMGEEGALFFVVASGMVEIMILLRYLGVLALSVYCRGDDELLLSVTYDILLSYPIHQQRGPIILCPLLLPNNKRIRFLRRAISPHLITS